VWIAVAAIIVLALLAIYRVRSTGFQWSIFFATFKQIDRRWLVATVLLYLLTYIGRAFRWEVMLRPLRPHPSLWNVTSATVIGFTGVVLLGRAGELVRPYLISIKERVTFSSQMAVWFLERIFDLLMVLLIFGVALARLPAGLHVGASLQWVLRTGGYFVASIGAICILLLIVFRSFSGLAERRILSAITFLPAGIHDRIAMTLRAFTEGMECTRDRRFLALIVFYTLLEWVIIVSGNYCMLRAIPATSGFTLDNVMVYLGFVAFGSVVQIPGIGGGVQVASALVLTEIFGIKLEAATGIAILGWLLSWVIVVPFGLAFAFHEGVNWNRIRHISQDVQTGAIAQANLEP
jgi:uncharacterized protein (TIRG00374 family)